MSELSGLSTEMLFDILTLCNDSYVLRGDERPFARSVREAAQQALASVRETPKPQAPYGPQCRTMLSQRPCGMVSCTRPECNTF